jgi:hypothetical protein
MDAKARLASKYVLPDPCKPESLSTESPYMYALPKVMSPATVELASATIEEASNTEADALCDAESALIPSTVSSP